MDTLCWFQVSILVFHRYYMYYSLLCIVFGAGVKKVLELNKTSWYIVCRHETKNRIRKVIVNITLTALTVLYGVYYLIKHTLGKQSQVISLLQALPQWVLLVEKGVGDEQNQWRAGSQREKERVIKTMLFLYQTLLVGCLLFDHSHWLRACNRLLVRI